MKLLCSFLMLQEKVMDCWWESLAMMLWSWKKIAWRSMIWLLHVHLNLHVAKMTPSLPSPCSHLPPKPTPPKKRERKRGRKDVNAPQMGEGKRQSYAISFVFAGNEDQNQIALDYGIKCIEMQVLPLSSLVSASPQSCEYRGVQQRDRRE